MTLIPHAEVIGDPISHSKSPAIHLFWLEKLGMTGDYRATRVTPAELPAYLEGRRKDPRWRGCNVTIPLKTEMAALVGDPVGACATLGAVNCVVKTPLGCLLGTNTDVLGIEAALGHVALKGAKACMIGSGGAARAMFCFLGRQELREIALVTRNPAQAEALLPMLPADTGTEVRVLPFDGAAEAIGGAALVVNATPLGMSGKPAMTSDLLAALSGAAADATLFDMVYDPLRTAFLAEGERLGLPAVDGLAMLIGQADPAFRYFFGAAPPREFDAELRALLTR